MGVRYIIAFDDYPPNVTDLLASFMKNQNQLTARLIKQGLYLGCLVATTLLSPRLIGFPLQTLVPISGIIGTGMLYDLTNAQITRKANPNLSILNNLLTVPLRIGIQLKMALLWLNLKKRPDNYIHITSFLTTIISDNLKSIVLYLHFLCNELPSILALDSPSKSSPNELNRRIMSFFRPSVVKLSQKANLKKVALQVNKSNVLNAYANFESNTLTLNTGLVLSLRNRKLIDAVIAHEIGHLDRSMLDRIIYRSNVLFSQILYAMGFLNIIYGNSSISIRLLHTLGLMGMANIGYCGVIQGEEERADRKSCHLLDNPIYAVKLQNMLYRKKVDSLTPSSGENLFDLMLTDMIKEFKCSDHFLIDFARKVVGVGRHPSRTYRINAIKDEVKKFALN